MGLAGAVPFVAGAVAMFVGPVSFWELQSDVVAIFLIVNAVAVRGLWHELGSEFRTLFCVDSNLFRYLAVWLPERSDFHTWRWARKASRPTTV